MDTAVCPVCNHTHEIPKKYWQKNWRCPDCRTAFVPGLPERKPGFFGRLGSRFLKLFQT